MTKYLAIRKTYDNRFEVIEASIRHCRFEKIRKFGSALGSTKYKTKKGALNCLLRWKAHHTCKNHSLIVGILDKDEFTGEILN